MIYIPDPVLRASLVAALRARANAWHEQARVSQHAADWTRAHAGACVLEQAAHDLESAPLDDVSELRYTL